MIELIKAAKDSGVGGKEGNRHAGPRADSGGPGWKHKADMVPNDFLHTNM